jgi:hypothetical protein
MLSHPQAMYWSSQATHSHILINGLPPKEYMSILEMEAFQSDPFESGTRISLIGSYSVAAFSFV